MCVCVVVQVCLCVEWQTEGCDGFSPRRAGQGGEGGLQLKVRHKEGALLCHDAQVTTCLPSAACPLSKLCCLLHLHLDLHLHLRLHLLLLLLCCHLALSVTRMHAHTLPQVALKLSALKQQRSALQKEIKWIVKRDI